MVELEFWGGVSEIGGNKIHLKSQDGSILLDFGLSYTQEGEYFEEFLQPRTNTKLYDLIKLGLLPAKDGLYRKDAFCPNGFTQTCTPSPIYWTSPVACYQDACSLGGWKPDAVFISHAHADHCGYLPYLGDIPLYSSDTTHILMKAISQIGNLDGFDSDLTRYEERYLHTQGANATFPGAHEIKSKKPPTDRTFTPLTSDTQQNIVNNMNLTGFDVGHSIPGSMCALIETENKQILYSGDLRFHGRNQPNLSPLTDLKPDAMILEGTRIDETIPDNEQTVEDEITELIDQTPGLTMIGFSWKDIERYETVKNAATSCGKTPVFDAKIAYLLARLGRDIYGEGAKVFVERTDSMLYSKADYVNYKYKLGPTDHDNWNKANLTPRTFKTV